MSCNSDDDEERLFSYVLAKGLKKQNKTKQNEFRVHAIDGGTADTTRVCQTGQFVTFYDHAVALRDWTNGRIWRSVRRHEFRAAARDSE